MQDDLLRDKLQDNFEKKGVADRTYSRVEVSFPIRFMPVSKEDLERLRNSYLTHPTRDRIEPATTDPEGPAQSAPGTMSAAIMERLDRVERKLDQLLNSSGIATEKTSGSNYETAQCTDLSGSGLMFNSRWAMGKGWFLKLFIEVSDPTPLSITALGRVVRVEQDPTNTFYETACHFEAIHEEDREEIIAYIFKRHREIAQLRREQE